MLFLLLSITCLSHGLTILSPPVAQVGGTFFPVYQWKYQSMADIGFVWNPFQNYTLYTDFYASFCGSSGILGPMTVPPGYHKAIAFLAWNNPCSSPYKISLARNLGFQLVIGYDGARGDQWAADYSSPYTNTQGDPLYVTCGASKDTDMINLYQDWFNPTQCSLAPGNCDLASNFILSAVLSGLSAANWTYPTFRLEVPPSTVSGTFRQLSTPGSTASFALYYGVTTSLICLCLSIVKLFQFIVYQDRVVISFPIVVLSLCVLYSFFFVFGTVFFFFFTPLSQASWFILFLLCWPIAWSACMILGFYFRDISTLTSARNTSALLGKLTIPACIVIGLVWIVFLGIEIYTAVGAPGIMVPFWKNLLNGVSNDRFTFVFLQYAEAAVFYLCIVAVMFVLAFGAISVFLALQGTSATHRQSIINIVVLSVALFLVIGGFGLFRWSQGFSVAGFGWAYSASIADNYIIKYVLIDVIHHSCVIMLLCLSFRVSVSKEIEISKSATSSTSSISSSSSASKGSSSSSHADDPVIEL